MIAAAQTLADGQKIQEIVDQPPMRACSAKPAEAFADELWENGPTRCCEVIAPNC